MAWRTFLREKLNGFLCDMAAQAKAGYDAPATLTCHMSCPLVPGATVRGEDYYTTAQGMDILGITCYLVNRGPAFHQAAMTLDACESAAACFGKKAWLIEYQGPHGHAAPGMAAGNLRRPGPGLQRHFLLPVAGGSALSQTGRNRSSSACCTATGARPPATTWACA